MTSVWSVQYGERCKRIGPLQTYDCMWAKDAPCYLRLLAARNGGIKQGECKAEIYPLWRLKDVVWAQNIYKHDKQAPEQEEYPPWCQRKGQTTTERYVVASHSHLPHREAICCRRAHISLNCCVPAALHGDRQEGISEIVQVSQQWSQHVEQSPNLQSHHCDRGIDLRLGLGCCSHKQKGRSSSRLMGGCSKFSKDTWQSPCVGRIRIGDCDLHYLILTTSRPHIRGATCPFILDII